MSPPIITATSQQTRFHLSTDSGGVGLTKDLELKDLTISISSGSASADGNGKGAGAGAGAGETVLEDACLRVRGGVRYVLVGRNGVGKSTLLRALAEGRVPGVGRGVRVLMVGQRWEEEEAVVGGEARGKEGLGVVEYVVKSDKEMERVRRRWGVLHKALENPDDNASAVRALRAIKLEDHADEVEEKAREAKLRSGTRGMKARKELKKAEEEHVLLEERNEVFGDQTELAKEVNEAHAMLVDLEIALEGMSANSAEARATTLLKGLGFTDQTLTKTFSSLSSGWKMRTILASTLFQPCDILLLDEPTNFLDLPALLWLESHLVNPEGTSTTANTTNTTNAPNTAPPTLILVTHDQSFADAVAEEILVMKDKKIEPFAGTYRSYKLVKKEQRKRMLKMKSAQDKQKSHMEDTIANNIRAAKASGDDKRLKQAVSRQKKLDERMGMQVNANGGRFKLNRDLAGYHFAKRAEIVVPDEEGEGAGRFEIPRVPGELRFPGPLLSVENLTFTYKGVKAPTLKDVNLTIHLHDRIGIMGLNGAGKSTLVNCLLQSTTTTTATTSSSGNSSNPLVGSFTKQTLITHHPKLHTGHFSQHLVDSLPTSPTSTCLTHLLTLPHANPPFTEQTARATLAQLGLRGKTVSHIPIAALSGGQRVRLALATILFPEPPPHLLVLDEVTTHLDAESVVSLARGLRRFQGAVVVVSHDRWFVREVVERIGGEGAEDGDGGSSEDEEEDGDGAGGKGGRVKGVREVYVVGEGAVKKVKGGVEAFERRVRKRYGIL